MDRQPQWFVLEGIEGKTDIACQRLVLAGAELWRPFDVKREPERRSKATRRNRAELPTGPSRGPRRTARFGRYFFIRCVMTPSVFHELSNASHIRGFVCTPGTRTPYPVPDAQVDFLKENMPDRPAPGWADKVYKGMPVTVAVGPFAGHRGLVRSIDKRGILKVDLENRFGSPIPIVIEVGHVAEAAALAEPPNASNDNLTRPEPRRAAGA